MKNEMRLIDANDAVKLLRGKCVAKYPSTFIMGLLASATEISQMPTVDAVPVVHGEWIWTVTGEEDRAQYWRCSECNDKSYIEHNYCPNCGALMDGKGDAE